ncbi:low-density lipoprotein receptor-related protein 3, partial [Tachysurus ichikawai]
VSVLHSLRSAMRRQMRRHSSRRMASRRRLGRLWSRLFQRGSRLRGHILLLTPPGRAHTPSQTHPLPSGHTHVSSRIGNSSHCGVEGQSGEWVDLQAHAEALCLAESGSPASSSSSPALPRSTSDTLEDEDDENDDENPNRASGHRPRDERRSHGAPRRPSRLPFQSRASRRVVQGLAAELGAMPVTRYSVLGISPLSTPDSLTSSSSQNEDDVNLLTRTHVCSNARSESHTDPNTHSAVRDKSVKRSGIQSADTSSDEDENIVLFMR